MQQVTSAQTPFMQYLEEEETRRAELVAKVDQLKSRLKSHDNDYESSHMVYYYRIKSMLLVQSDLQDAQNRLALCENRIHLAKLMSLQKNLGI